jgi:hypothetical protein
MRRRGSRSLAALFTIWFAVALVEPAVLHVCPVHDAMASTAPASAHMHGGHDGASSSHPATTAHCLCLGDCAKIGSVGLPASVTSLASTTIIHARDTGLPDYAYVPVAVAHVIPFANGPPAV